MHDEYLLLILIFIGLIILVFVLPIRAAIKSSEALLQIGRMREHLAKLQQRLEMMQERLLKIEQGAPATTVEPVKEPEVEENIEPAPQEYLAARQRLAELTEPSHPEEHPGPGAKSPSTPPPLPYSFAASKAMPILSSTRKSTVDSSPATPPLRVETPKNAPAIKLPGLNLEQFMGVKLFAWLGGLALFFGIAFFVKYSFERGRRHTSSPRKI
ncbi:MAG: hypothetical protein K8R87_10730 [Verrucomicrobia bacterium]|nr:hypothetical protein [Verrucomicrobiota bacterium]